MMFGGVFVNGYALYEGIDDLVSNTNYSLDDVYKMTYYEFEIYRQIRLNAIKKQKDTESNDLKHLEKHASPNYAQPNFQVPKIEMPQMPKF